MQWVIETDSRQVEKIANRHRRQTGISPEQATPSADQLLLNSREHHVDRTSSEDRYALPDVDEVLDKTTNPSAKDLISILSSSKEFSRFTVFSRQVDVEDIRPQVPRPKAKAMVAKDADMISVASSRLSDLNVDNPKDFEYRVKIFLDSLKTHLVKQATQLRMSGGVDDSLVRMKASEFHESTARMMVTKAFQKYTGGGLV